MVYTGMSEPLWDQERGSSGLGACLCGRNERGIYGEGADEMLRSLGNEL